MPHSYPLRNTRTRYLRERLADAQAALEREIEVVFRCDNEYHRGNRLVSDATSETTRQEGRDLMWKANLLGQRAAYKVIAAQTDIKMLKSYLNKWLL